MLRSLALAIVISASIFYFFGVLIAILMGLLALFGIVGLLIWIFLLFTAIIFIILRIFPPNSN